MADASAPQPDPMDELLAAMLQEIGADEAARPIRPRADVTADAPLSFTQEVLWLLHQLSPELTAYNVRWALRIHGPLDVDALRRALRLLVGRQHVLRTVCVATEDGPRQRVLPDADLSFRQRDLRGQPEQAREDAITEELDAAANRRWNFAADTLHATLLRVADDECVLLLCLHHIYCDGWSRAVFFRELGALYRHAVSGAPHGLAPLPVQFADVAEWQREEAGRASTEADLRYWEQRLDGAPPVLELPTDFLRPRVQSFRGAREARRLPPALADQVRAMAEPGKYTLFMVLLAAYKVLLSRYAGTEDVVVGTPVAGRTRQELEGLIGYFVNALVVRTDLAGDPSFAQLLDRVRESCLGAFDHQDVSFDQLLLHLKPARNLSHSPLFQVMFILQNMPSDLRELAGLAVTPVPLGHDGAKFDVTLSCMEVAGTIQLTLGYNTDLFRPETAARMLEDFTQILRSVVATPTVPLSRISLLSVEEQRTLVTADAVEIPFPDTACIHQLIEAQVDARPDAVALVAGDEELTYRTFNARASAVARALHERGVAVGDAVGVCLGRGLDLPVALFAVLKAGATCVPLDPAYPAPRLRAMIRDAAVAVVVGEPTTAEQVGADDDGPPWFPVTALLELGAGLPEVPVKSRAGDAAYILFTSGSTGVPRAVRLSHRGLVNHHVAAVALYGLTPDDRVLQFASPSFDISIEEMFPTWIAGGTVVLRPDEYAGPPFVDWMNQQRITVLNFPTAFWHEWTLELDALDLAIPSAIRMVIVGGERADGTLLTTWRRRVGSAVRWVNTYGPTEASVIATAYEPTEADFAAIARGEQDIPIGRPIANVRTYVVDAAGQLTPPGVPGELWIGGPGVALGYANAESETLARFVKDPFDPSGSGRVYRTGDRARRRPDGLLEFLGRLDGQVKIRGHRVEPGEVEVLLRRDRRVLAAAVVIAGVGASRGLVAYVVSRAPDLDVEELDRSLRAQLPEFLVPSHIVVLPVLPLTNNGKLDRRALPAPGESRRRIGVAPSGPTEEALARLWCAILDHEAVGAQDDFFSLGGHSLLAMRLLSRIKTTMGASVSLRQFFDVPTIAGLARAVDAQTNGDCVKTTVASVGPVSIPRLEGDEGPASLAQEALWWLQRSEPELAAYNVGDAWEIEGPLNVSTLDTALQRLVERHAVFRTRFVERDGQLLQVIHPAGNEPLEVIDLSGLPSSERIAAAQAAVDARLRQPFDLSTDQLLRTLLLRVDEARAVLLLVTHHIIYDGWSRGVVLRELSNSYEMLLSSSRAELPALPVRFVDFTAWQLRALDGGEFERQMAFWLNHLAGASLAVALPTDRPRGRSQRFDGGKATIVLPATLKTALNQLAREHHATLYLVLLAAFEALIHRYTHQMDLVIGTPVAGRVLPELEGMVGYFMNTLPLRTRFEGDLTFGELLDRVREGYLSASEHAELPFQRLVLEAGRQGVLQGGASCQVMFLYQNDSLAEVRFGDARAKPFGMDLEAAKFDLYLSMRGKGDSLVATLKYRSELFDPSTIDRMLHSFHQILAQVAVAPETRLDAASLLDPGERKLVIEEWSATAPVTSDADSIVDLFSTAVERAPDADAVEAAGWWISYSELDRMATSVARRLKERGVGPNVLVGLCLERSPQMVAVVLGVLKAGAAYLPLDPRYPADRLAYILADSGAALVVTEPALHGVLPTDRIELLDLHALTEPGVIPGVAAPFRGPAASDLAYAIYTSGSTGRPKGVEIEHRSVVNFLAGFQGVVPLDAKSVLVAITPLSFDISVLELLAPLVVGARLVIATWEEASDPHALAALLDRTGATHLQATPSTWRMLVDAGWPGRPDLVALCGGEALPQSLADALVVRGLVLWNLYGPTEATIWATMHRQERSGDPVRIGRPMPGVRAYVLGPRREPVAIGVEGSLYIAGAGLARGYRGRPELTQERFVPDPFSGEPSDRMYETGDRVRWHEDGTLEYLGRSDFQVKLRGHRIELGEVEEVLSRQPGITSAVVLIREDRPGDQRLVAYVVSDGSTAPEERLLRDQLRTVLPAIMVPAAIVRLPALPMTPNGKVDRKALPVPPETATTTLAPRTPLEQEVAEVWMALLGVSELGIEDDFFELGGNSLLAMRMVAEIERVHGQRLPFRSVFESPTVAGIAAFIASRVHEDEEHGVPVLQPDGPGKPLAFVHGDILGYGWYLRHLAPLLGSSPLIVLRTLGPEYPGAPMTIEEMARVHLAALRDIQPRGPYRLGGYCHGGLIAYEMARQLAASGETVESLSLVDAFCPNGPLRRLQPLLRRFYRGTTAEAVVASRARVHYRIHYFRRRLREVFRMSMRQRLLWAANLTRHVTGMSRAPADLALEEEANLTQAPGLGVVGQFVQRAQRAYVPDRYDGRVDVIWGTKTAAVRSGNLGGGWQHVAVDLHSHTVEGTHTGIVMPAALPALAAVIRHDGPEVNSQ